MRAAVPENERDRLRALSRYGPLNDIPEASFNRLTRLAAHLFSAPMAAVTLLDAQRLVAKSCYGIPDEETAREGTICEHAILVGGITFVCDATQDIRFKDIRMVVGVPFIRFYAAAPLTTSDGFRLGTLCVMDHKTHPEVDARHAPYLEDLAAEVVELLELYRIQRELTDTQVELHAQYRELEASREAERKTEQRVTLALEAGRMGYWERDAKTDLVTLSSGLSTILGLEAREHHFSMDDWLQSVHPDDRSTVIETVERAARTQENYLLKYRSMAPDGSERWLSSSGMYRMDKAGNFLGAQGVSWDSTATEVVEQQLKTSEELFRGLSDSAPVGVFCLGLDGQMTYANPRTAAICDRPAEALLGRGWLEVVHPEDRTGTSAALTDKSVSVAGPEYEFRLLLADGEIRWVHARTSTMRDQAGKPAGRIGTLDDVSQRRQVMEELRKAKEAAEVASRTKDMFLANVSHELRTPLNGVLGMVGLLMDTSLSREQEDMAGIILESGQSLLTLVNDLLDVSRIEAGKIKIERHPFNLPTLLVRATSVIDSEAKKKGLNVLVDYPADLPKSYLGDQDRIGQILLNYLSNAVKFTLAGDIKIVVKGEAAGADETLMLTLSVTDKGPGIDEEAQKRLFQAFSQVDGSSTRRSGGVGLGLAISKRLAELMEGGVGLISAPGRGSTFWLRLPLLPVPEATEIDQPPAPMAMQGSGRVLVVEDNPVNQRVTAGALRKLGWEADIAPNGLVALELFCRNEYTMVFMDCHMPEMDGFVATQEIRRWEKEVGRPSVPVVALTAHAMTGDRERCLDAGMNDYLAKPFGLDELRSVISSWTLSPVPGDL